MRGDFIFEPEPEQILERLLPVYVETELYRALLESAASSTAPATAMRNASKNARADRHPYARHESSPRPRSRRRSWKRWRADAQTG
jgi:F0F1-type ATP synthase gamma subunit